jgi:putative Holliday junction resolvase
MRVLAIDYGDRRVGLAKGSTGVGIAFPFKVLENFGDVDATITSVEKIVDDEMIEYILVGMPISLESKDTLQTLKVRKFVDGLKRRIAVKVEELDERFTSELAKKYLPKGKSIDIESARIILEEWFVKNGHHK